MKVLKLFLFVIFISFSVIIDDKNKYQVIFNELKKLFNLLSEQEKLELNYKLS